MVEEVMDLDYSNSHLSVSIPRLSDDGRGTLYLVIARAYPGPGHTTEVLGSKYTNREILSTSDYKRSGAA